MGDSRSPRVLSDSWGKLEIEDLGAVRDAKLWPGGGRPWDWNETGTRHEPGIQPADLDDLLVHAPEIVILSRGREERLQACAETFTALEERGVDVEWHETSRAIEIYNTLAVQGRRVAALLHSTC
jgi:hypothetical protein